MVKTMPYRVMQRDLRVMTWAGEQYAARLDHVQAVMGVHSWTIVYNVTARLRKLGLVETRKVVVKQPTWVIPTAAGLKMCGLPYRVWRPALNILTHVGAVGDVRVHVEARSPGVQWIGERALLREYEGRAPIPDAVAIVGDRRAAIEVELSPKSDNRLRRVLDDLTKRYDGIVYYCAPITHRQLERLQQSEPRRWPTLAIRELPPPPPGWEKQ
jgi:hypothetical protein